jgi:hypothetical protein
MGKARDVACMILLVGCAVAHAARVNKESARWDAVEGLPSGALVAVLPENQAGPDMCRVSSVDDNALTCVPIRAVPSVRLVFPRAAVREVWAVELEHERHIGRWIRIGIEVGLVIAGSVGSGVVGGLFFAGAAILLETVIAENPMPPRPPRSRRRLVYYVPQGTPASP